MRAVNLLPEEFRPRQRTGEGARGGYVVVGVLGTLLVMVLLYAVTANQVNSTKTDVATARADADRAEAKSESGGTFTNFRQVKETRLASVRDLAKVRFDWERTMRELARVMPEDTWVFDLSASTTTEQPQGASGGGGGAAESTPPPATTPSSGQTAGAAATAAGGVSPTLHLTGCALAQPDVAVVMVRLRKLHRAIDVTLGESVEEEDATAGAAGDSASGETDGCGSRRFKFDVTVTFAAVDPDNAKPLKVPASLGGGS